MVRFSMFKRENPAEEKNKKLSNKRTTFTWIKIVEIEDAKLYFKVVRFQVKDFSRIGYERRKKEARAREAGWFVCGL